MPEIEQKEFESDMKEMETRIKVLRAEYNQYLNGTAQFPPNFGVAQIRKLMKKYAAVKGLKGVQRFQYYNFVAKFNTLIEFYGRRIKDKQEGTRMTFGYTRKGNEADNRKQIPKSQPAPMVKKGGFVISDTRIQNATMKSMYEVWNQTSSHGSSGLPELDLKSFTSLIQKKTDQICRVKNCKAVRYKIALDQGKVKIKAKPVE